MRLPTRLSRSARRARRAGVEAAIVPLVLGGSVAAAQGRDSVSVPRGAFAGTIKSSVDGGPVRSVDVRLYFVDSLKTIRDSSGQAAMETFVDSAASRIAISDSVGYFVMWRVRPGRYVMNVRRIGFSPVEAIVTIDSGTVFDEMAMTPLLSILSKVDITASASTAASRRLDRVGFANRAKFGEATASLTQADIARRKPNTLRDILDVYGIHDAEILIDRMPFEYPEVFDYPADQIAGLEIYRHTRPIEYSGTRRGPTLLQSGGGSNLMKALVLIWTY